MAEKQMEHHHHGHFLFTLGVLAIVYGIIQYLTTGAGVPPYTAWIVGGVVLLLVHWVKKSMMGSCC